jgi:hypothetical protein
VPKLYNVRLDETRSRKVRRLRESGCTLSDVVRDAIDARYEALGQPGRGVDPAAVVAGILERYPDDPADAEREYDVHDGVAARRAVRRALGRRRP